MRSPADSLPGLLVGLAVLATTLPYLDAAAWSGEEAKRVLIAGNMMDTGHYLLPRLHDQPYLAKPPLFNWQIVLGARATGSLDLFAARLGNAIALALLVTVLGWIVSRELSRWALWTFCLSLVLARGVMEKAQVAEIDMQFATLVSLALWTWYAAYRDGRAGLRLWGLPVLFAGLSFLSKGPPGPLFFGLGVGAWLAVEKRWSLLRGGGFLASLLALAALVLGWALFLRARVPPELIEVALATETSERFTELPPWRRLLQPVTVPVTFVLTAFPFCLWLVFLARREGRGRLAGDERRLGRFALVVILANLPVYFIPDANMRYLLPLTPCLLVLCALGLESALRGGPWSWPLRGTVLALLAFSALLILAPPLNLVVGRPHLLPAPVVLPAALLLMAGVIGTLRLLPVKPAAAAGMASVLVLAGMHFADLDLRRRYLADRDAVRRDSAGIVAEVSCLSGGRPGSVATVEPLYDDFFLFDEGGVLRPKRARPPEAGFALVFVEGDGPAPAWSRGWRPVGRWQFDDRYTVLLLARGPDARAEDGCGP